MASQLEGVAAVWRDDLSALALLVAGAALLHTAGQAEGRAAATALAGSAIVAVSLATVLWRRRDDT